MTEKNNYAALLAIVHEEAGRTLSRDDFELCMRVAKRAALVQQPKNEAVADEILAKAALCDSYQLLAASYGFESVDSALLAACESDAAPAPSASPELYNAYQRDWEKVVRWLKFQSETFPELANMSPEGAIGWLVVELAARHEKFAEPSASPAALTDEQIEAIWQATPTDGIHYIYGEPAKELRTRFARALLAASPADQVRPFSSKELAEKQGFTFDSPPCAGVARPLASDKEQA